ncbi:hypothetical protein H8S37_12835 [Mediterraneibacter sp. NSJ-55]|uniref:Uncharacterized protein n=1 Tax=Mediterraneibacter hominis TaxID=2763054 RepID=A0A923LKM7_9FIRM|nr:hypothetical protein [Mediterraneibacter hominis]MBC5689802.1 hypothetical protein [Mediterraneibacter hominis]
MLFQEQREKARLELYRKYLKEEDRYCPTENTGKKEPGGKKTDREKDPVWEIGNYVMGPVLNAFVLWVLRQALQSGKKRLYFLARDGYFMYRAALVYKERLGLDIDCRYVACSRYALRLPMFHLNEREALTYICRDSIGLNMERVLNRAGLKETEKEEVLTILGRTGKESVSYAQLKELKKELSACGVFMNAMRRRSLEAMPALCGYLAQEGFLECVPDAVVDSGWVGSMQKTLQEVLTYMGRKEELEGYYFGLYELPWGVKRQRYHCYYFSPEGQLCEKVRFNNNVFESFFSAPHGMTLGYKQRGGRFAPVYGEISLERKRYMERLEKVLMQYIQQAAERVEDIRQTDCENRKGLKKTLGLFMGKPTRKEAEQWGRLQFCDDVLEYGEEALAVKMSRKELKENHLISKLAFLLGIRKKSIKESAWYEGSAVRCARHPGYHLIQYSMYKYLLYIRQIYMWRRKNGRKEKNGA